MTAEQIAKSISYCGLLCSLCSSDGSCNCKGNNHCNRQDCYQYKCCNERGFNGCWECPDFSCDKDMFNESHPRLKVLALSYINLITDISVLAGLTNLERLYFHEIPISGEQLAELTAALPNTQIIN